MPEPTSWAEPSVVARRATVGDRSRWKVALRDVRLRRTPERGKAGRPTSMRWHRWVTRVAVVYDVEGPRVRLGLLWFAVLVASLVAGQVVLGVVFGAVAAVASSQAAREWRRARRPAPRVALVAGLLPLAAALGTPLLGVAVLVLVGAALAAAVAGQGTDVAVDAARTVKVALFAGLAGAAPVVTYRYSVGAAVTLLVLVSAYEVGDYLVGSGGTHPVEGPAAGVAAVIVVTFTISVLAVPPFQTEAAWAFGLLAMLLAPLGQLAASLVLPSAGADAPALRRLDSLVVLGPVWAWAVGLYVAGS